MTTYSIIVDGIFDKESETALVDYGEYNEDSAVFSKVDKELRVETDSILKFLLLNMDYFGVLGTVKEVIYVFNKIRSTIILKIVFNTMRLKSESVMPIIIYSS